MAKTDVKLTVAQATKIIKDLEEQLEEVRAGHAVDMTFVGEVDALREMHQKLGEKMGLLNDEVAKLRERHVEIMAENEDLARLLEQANAGLRYIKNAVRAVEEDAEEIKALRS